MSDIGRPRHKRLYQPNECTSDVCLCLKSSMEVHITTTLLLLATLPAVLTLPWKKLRDNEILREYQPRDNFGKSEQSAIQVAGVFDGCYSDTEAQILGKSGWISESDVNINANCVIACTEKGYTVASTQGRHCYCTNSLPQPQLHHANDGSAAGSGGPCSLTCPGAITTGDCRLDECCGGEHAYTVYKLGQPSDVNKQLFESKVQSLNGVNDKLQEGAEHSDIETPSHHFHQAHLQAVGTFDGCYRDSESGVLNGATGLTFQFSDNYNAKCQLECQESGYPIASTKGIHCYCTYNLPLPQIHRADDRQSAGITGPCRTTCPGSFTTVGCQGDECCGGPNAASVYIVGQIDAMKQLQRRIVNKILDTLELRRNIFRHKPKESFTDLFEPHSYCQGFLYRPDTSPDKVVKLRTSDSFVECTPDGYSLNIFVRMNSECTFDGVTIGLIYSSDAVSVQDIPPMTIGLLDEEQTVYSRYYENSDYNEVRRSSDLSHFDLHFSAPDITASSIFMQTSPDRSDCTASNRPAQYTISATGVRCTPNANKIGVSVTARGRTATSEGVSESDAVYNLMYLKGKETLTSVPLTQSPLTVADKLDLNMITMEKLIESDWSSAIEEPFSDWDIACDNTFGTTDLSCGKEFSESTSFEESWSTEHGFNLQVTVGAEFEAGGLFAKAKTTFELSQGYSFTSGYSKSQSYERSETFPIKTDVPPGHKTEVRFFKSEIPVQIKWRATIFAAGYVLIDILDEAGESLLSEPAKLHLTQILSASERELFAFGTIDYGERPTLIARLVTYDRNGNRYSEKDTEMPVAPDLSDE